MHKLQTQLTKPIPFFYTREYGYDPIKNKELPKPKYHIKIDKKHCVIITEPHTDYPKWHVFSLPIKHVLHVSTKLLKILFRENLISQHQVQLAYNQWVKEESTIIMEKTDHKNQLKERIKFPVRRRGNEHYHKYVWSRLQWYQLVFDSIPLIEKQTEKKTKHKGKNRKEKLHNTFIVTLTYPRRNHLGKAWQDTSADLNRFFTNLKGRLERRDNKLLFYVKALESQKSGMPHVHIIMKLKNSIPCYGIPTKHGTYYRPFNKELFHWNYGFYDVRGVKQSPNVMSYITKYITKQTNPETGKTSKTLALSWMSQKRLWSSSMFDLFKWKFPNLATKMKLTEKFTVNKAVDTLWNGLKFPKVNWKHISQGTKASLGFKRRGILDRHADLELRPAIPSRLNNEGFYQVTALAVTKPQADGSKFTILRTIDIVSRRLREYQRLKRKRIYSR